MKRIQPMSRSEANALLEPHFRSFDRVVRCGVGSWFELPPEHRNPVRKNRRLRADWINAYMVVAAGQEFAGVEGVWTGYRSQQFVVSIEDRAVIRLKMLDHRFMASAIQTQQQYLWDGQLPLPSIPGPATRLTAGYQLDRDSEEIICVAITCCVDGRLEWVIRLPDFGFGGTYATLIPDTDASGPSITPKTADEVKRDEDIG